MDVWLQGTTAMDAWNKYRNGCMLQADVCGNMFESNGRQRLPEYSQLLQNYSINYLIAHGIVPPDVRKDLLYAGLDMPRGLLGSGFSDPPPASYDYYAPSANCNQVAYEAMKRPLSSVAESVASLSSFSPSSLSDCSGSNSSSAFDASPSGSNSVRLDSDNSTVSSPDGSLTEILNSLTLNDNYHSCLNVNVDLANLHNLAQANYACVCMQQSPPGHQHTGSACPSWHSTSRIDKWNAGISDCNAQRQKTSSNGTISDSGSGRTMSCSSSSASSSSSSSSTSSSNCEANQLDCSARFHRNLAHVFDATCTWSGVLPERRYKASGFSTKVFLGGLPWDISEHTLVDTFAQFGPVRVEWPGKDKQATQPKGFVYIIFEAERQVRSLLQACSTEYSGGGGGGGSNWYFRMSSKRMRAKDVQVIPWLVHDANYTKSQSQKLDPSRTVFVGALHGMLNAEGLATIMNDLFDGVVYAGIDTDKFKYPIGSGRVTFNNSRSYMKAVAAAYVDIKTSKFSKKVQVDPYLEDSLCSLCGVQQAPYFCRDLFCFRYFCRACWNIQHQYGIRQHKLLMRNSKAHAAPSAAAMAGARFP